MKKIMSLALVFIFSISSFAQTTNEDVWIGKYAHENDVGKEYFMLEIFRDSDKIKGRYKETVSAQTSNKFTVNVAITGNIASFYLAECLPLNNAEKDDGGRNDCGGEGGYQKGDLILKLKRVVKGNKVTFNTIGGKLTEAGFAGEIDFVKTKKFYYSF